METITTETIEQDGRTYQAKTVYDHDAGAPWDNMSTFGTVTDWERRDKRPSERILNSDNRGFKRFYDFAAAVKQAKKDGYNGAGGMQSAVDVVEQEFSYFKAWCDDEWCYVGVIVTILHDDGMPSATDSSLWGIDSESTDYINNEVIPNLIREIEYQLERA